MRHSWEIEFVADARKRCTQRWSNSHRLFVVVSPFSLAVSPSSSSTSAITFAATALFDPAARRLAQETPRKAARTSRCQKSRTLPSLLRQALQNVGFKPPTRTALTLYSSDRYFTRVRDWRIRARPSLYHPKSATYGSTPVLGPCLQYSLLGHRNHLTTAD